MNTRRSPCPAATVSTNPVTRTAEGATMPRIFLSFRKADSRWMRDRVYRALADRFGANEIFKSGESIPPGADFAEVLRRQAADCELMFVLIGPTWLDACGDHGARLIDRANDWV